MARQRLNKTTALHLLQQMQRIVDESPTSTPPSGYTDVTQYSVHKRTGAVIRELPN